MKSQQLLFSFWANDPIQIYCFFIKLGPFIKDKLNAYDLQPINLLLTE